MSLSVGSAMAADVLQPFVLAYKTTGDVSTVASDVKGKLTGAGFEIVGEYSPYAGADIIVVTNDALKANAAKSDRGGYGAAQRVAVTKNGDDVEVSYTNPVYMAAVYRMAGDLADVRAQLEGALGAESEFGSEKNLTADDLRKYHYTVMMEYFDDPSELAEYDNHAEAVKAVEAGLAAGAGANCQGLPHRRSRQVPGGQGDDRVRCRPEGCQRRGLQRRRVHHEPYRQEHAPPYRPPAL